jgi:hypothetical protein
MLRSPSVPITEDGEEASKSIKQIDLAKDELAQTKNERLFNLHIKLISWPTEGRGLLHIVSPLLYLKEFKIRSAMGSYYLFRNEAQAFISWNGAETPEGGEVVARFDIKTNGVAVDCSQYKTDQNQGDIWEEISKDSDGRIIRPNDVMRFGSYKVRLVDAVLSDEGPSVSLKPFSTTDDRNELQSEHTSNLSEAQSTSGPVCRICFEPSDELNNVLLSPCSCSGSLRYIHVECLRRWLDGQLQVKQFENGGGSYLIRTIACEICKSAYSKSVYESILIPRPKCPHIIIEDFAPSQQGSKIHLVPLSKQKPIRLGRSKENDIVLADISVSRVHAAIQLTENGLKLVDLSSKFGSLVQLPTSFFHQANGLPLRVQIGSCLVELIGSHPSRLERILPDRFLQEKGSIKLVRSKSPSERILEADRIRRSRSGSNATPTSPAMTFVRSPVSLREALIDEEPVPLGAGRST